MTVPHPIAGWLRYPRTRKRPVAVLRALREGPKRASSFHGKTLRGLRREKHIAIVRNTGADPLIEATQEGLAALALTERRCGHVNGPCARFRPRQPCGRMAPFDDGAGAPRCGSHTPEALARAKARGDAMRAAYYAANPPRSAA